MPSSSLVTSTYLHFKYWQEVLKDGDHLVDVVPLELRSHGQIVLEHISCLGVLRVVHLESTRCCRGLLSVHAWR